MPRPDEPYCYHEEEEQAYKMRLEESGIETAYSTNQIRNADRYRCTHDDCDNQILTGFGAPRNFHGIADVINLLSGDR